MLPLPAWKSRTQPLKSRIHLLWYLIKAPNNLSALNKNIHDKRRKYILLTNGAMKYETEFPNDKNYSGGSAPQSSLSTSIIVPIISGEEAGE